VVPEQLDRRLVAVVFTDMVGYTALLQTDERSALEKRDPTGRRWSGTTTRSAARSCSDSATAA
jgi:class 3 adenylate cyclase